MVTKNFPEEHPEDANPEDINSNNSLPVDDSLIGNPKSDSQSASSQSGEQIFAFSDEDEDIETVRRAIMEMDARSNSNPLTGFSTLDPVVPETPSFQSHPDFEKWLRNLEQGGDEPPPGFAPFNSTEETNVGLSQAPAAFSDEEPGETVQHGIFEPEINLGDTIVGLSSENILDQMPGEDNLSARISSLGFGMEDIAQDQATTIPPFLVDDFEDLDEAHDTLPEKIKKGLVPAETIELLITETMKEDEVIQITKEMGIDWTLIPGDDRATKIQFVVDYFKKKEGTRAFAPEVSSPVRPKFVPQRTDEDWRDSDSRLQALQESLVVPGTPEKPSRGLSFSSSEDEEPTNPLVRALTIGLSLVAVILVAIVGYFIYQNFNKPPVAVTPTPYQSSTPFPSSIQIPGGWTFPLKVGSLVDGNWNPTEAEWLAGTEVCRAVSLPWSKQLYAVFGTFQTGDGFQLIMNNNDVLNYQVLEVKTIPSSDINIYIGRSSPCLVVELTKTNTDERLVVISEPVYITIPTAVPTATP